MMNDLLKQYEQTRATLKKNNPTNAMMQDLNWTIKYLETGIPPDINRPVHRKDIPIDARIMEKMGRGLYPEYASHKGNNYPIKMRVEALQIYMKLSKQEKRAFWLIHVDCLSYGKAAEKMHIVKSAVQLYVKNAHKKIEKMLAQISSVS